MMAIGKTGASKTKLKPCPFCGGTKTELERAGTWNWIHCLKCNALGPRTDSRTVKQVDAKVRRDWNNRKAK